MYDNDVLWIIKNILHLTCGIMWNSAKIKNS